MKILHENKIDYLIPTCEEVFYISYIKDFLESNSNCKVFCHDFDLLARLHSKYTYIDHIKPFSIVKCPETLLFNNETDVRDFINTNQGYKYVLKPEFSRFAGNIASNLIAGKNINKFQFESNSKYVIQEYIDGDAICIFAVFSRGNLTIYSFYKNLLTYSGGSGVYFKNHSDKILEKFLIDFGQETSYHGQISFDIIMNDLGYYIIECNPRTTSGIHLFSHNIDFRNIFVSSMDYKSQQNILTPNKGSKSFKLILVIFMIGFLFNSKKRLHLYNGLFKTEDIVYDANDPKPFYSQFYEYIYYIFESLITQKSITKIMTNDIEYNGFIKNII